MLTQEGMTLEEYRKEVRLQLQRTRLVNREVRSKVVITQDEIKKYYEKNKQKYGGSTQYYLWNLFVKLPSGARSSDREAARERLGQSDAELNRVGRSRTSPGPTRTASRGSRGRTSGGSAWTS